MASSYGADAEARATEIGLWPRFITVVTMIASVLGSLLLLAIVTNPAAAGLNLRVFAALIGGMLAVVLLVWVVSHGVWAYRFHQYLVASVPNYPISPGGAAALFGIPLFNGIGIPIVWYTLAARLRQYDSPPGRVWRQLFRVLWVYISVEIVTVILTGALVIIGPSRAVALGLLDDISVVGAVLDVVTLSIHLRMLALAEKGLGLLTRPSARHPTSRLGAGRPGR